MKCERRALKVRFQGDGLIDREGGGEVLGHSPEMVPKKEKKERRVRKRLSASCRHLREEPGEWCILKLGGGGLGTQSPPDPHTVRGPGPPGAKGSGCESHSLLRKPFTRRQLSTGL